MAEDCVDHAVVLARLEERPCVTQNWPSTAHRRPERRWTSERVWNRRFPDRKLARRNQVRQSLTFGSSNYWREVLWAVRYEMARTVDDVLARRTRALFLNSKAAIAMAPAVAGYNGR